MHVCKTENISKWHRDAHNSILNYKTTQYLNPQPGGSQPSNSVLSTSPRQPNRTQHFCLQLAQSTLKHHIINNSISVLISYIILIVKKTLYKSIHTHNNNRYLAYFITENHSFRVESLQFYIYNLRNQLQQTLCMYLLPFGIRPNR